MGLRTMLDQRRQHQTLQKTAATELEWFATLTLPEDRAQTLLTLADLHDRLADLLDQTRSGTRADKRDGFTPADTHHHISILCRLLADVENALATATPRNHTVEGLELAVGPTLDRMATTLDLGHRHSLLARLYVAARPDLGDRAVQFLATLPAPGWVGWSPTGPRQRVTPTV